MRCARERSTEADPAHPIVGAQAVAGPRREQDQIGRPNSCAVAVDGDGGLTLQDVPEALLAMLFRFKGIGRGGDALGEVVDLVLRIANLITLAVVDLGNGASFIIMIAEPSASF